MGGCGNSKQTEKKNPRMGLIESTGDRELKLKLCMSGEVAVGKSLFYHTYFGTTSKFNNASTQGSGDNNCKKVDLPGVGPVLVSIWDTAGQERYASITKIFFKGSDGIIILFDVTSETSFKRVESYWLQELSKELDLSNITVCLVANKIDLPNRAVTTEEGEAFAKKHNLLYREASALQGKGVVEAVSALVEAVCKKKKSGQASIS